MRITETQLFDYISCPLTYNLRYNMKMDFHEQTSMNQLLNMVASYFYMNIMNGRIIQPSGLKKKWDSICEKNSDYIDTKKCLEGMGSIMKLFQWAYNEKILISDIHEPYVITTKGTHEIVDVAGEIGAIVSLPNGTFQLLITDFSNRYPDK